MTKRKVTQKIVNTEAAMTGRTKKSLRDWAEAQYSLYKEGVRDHRVSGTTLAVMGS